MRRWPTLSALLMVAALLPPALSAQRRRTPEAQALRDAGTLEARGRLTEAEAILQLLLEEQPTSAGGLFALERVLRAQGRPDAVLPAADRFLAITPDASGVRYLKLKVLAEVDSVAAMARETEAWILRAPADPLLYSEALPLWERTHGPEQMLELLSRARRASGDPVAIAPEIGDLLMSAGRTKEGAAEWARAVGSGGEHAVELLRRLERIDDAPVRTRLVDTLMDALGRTPPPPKRRTVVVQVALAFQRTELGLELANELAPQLDLASRRAFLENVSVWGSDVDAAGVTLWALTNLRELTGEGGDLRAIDLRIHRTALSAGDTATVIEAAQRLAKGLPIGSFERRLLLAEEISMGAGRADPAALATAFDWFRREFPGAPELDGLAGLVSARLQTGGDAAGASAVLANVKGPESSIERAFLSLTAGDVAEARAALIVAVAVGGLSPTRATGAIQLASLLGRLSGAGAAAVAQAAAAGHQGRGLQAAHDLEQRLPDLPAADRPMLLAEAARLAAGADGDEDAARIRTTLLVDYPDAAEAAEAALAQARWHARTPAGVGTAIQLLEELIVKVPGSAVAPAARLELQRLKDPS